MAQVAKVIGGGMNMKIILALFFLIAQGPEARGAAFPVLEEYAQFDCKIGGVEVYLTEVEATRQGEFGVERIAGRQTVIGVGEYHIALPVSLITLTTIGAVFGMVSVWLVMAVRRRD